MSGRVWRRSSRSNGNGGNNCVEVAQVEQGMLVRDSKDPNGLVLAFDLDGWAAFVAGVKGGEFDTEA